MTRDPMECEAVKVTTRAAADGLMPAGFLFRLAILRFDGEEPEPFCVMDAEQVADLIYRFNPVRVELQHAPWESASAIEDEFLVLMGLSPKVLH